MADAPDLGSGGAILRGSSPLPGTSLGLAAILKEKQLGASIGKVKADGAIAANKIARDTTTGSHAMDLMNTDMSADVKLAPRFDERSALRLVREKNFQSRAFVFDVTHR